MKRSVFRLALVQAFLAGMEATLQVPSDEDVREAMEQNNPGLPLMKLANRFSVIELQKYLEHLEEG